MKVSFERHWQGCVWRRLLTSADASNPTTALRMKGGIECEVSMSQAQEKRVLLTASRRMLGFVIPCLCTEHRKQT